MTLAYTSGHCGARLRRKKIMEEPGTFLLIFHVFQVPLAVQNCGFRAIANITVGGDGDIALWLNGHLGYFFLGTH